MPSACRIKPRKLSGYPAPVELTRDYDASPGSARVIKRPAELFDLHNAEKPSKWVRLKSCLGRHRIIVGAHDSRLDAEGDLRMRRLYRDAARIENADIKVLVVSGALPQENRKVIRRVEQAGGRIPFPLLTDPPPTPAAPEMGYLVYHAWKRYDKETGQLLPGIFLIDEAGLVEWNGDGPKSVEPADPELDRFIRGL